MARPISMSHSTRNLPCFPCNALWSTTTPTTHHPPIPCPACPSALPSLLLPLACSSAWAASPSATAQACPIFSKNPAAATNCHIMKPQLDSWQKANHHTLATCVDCHLPHDFFAKYIAKTEKGYNHSRAFTLQDFHEPILIKEKTAASCNKTASHATAPLCTISSRVAPPTPTRSAAPTATAASGTASRWGWAAPYLRMRRSSKNEQNG